MGPARDRALGATGFAALQEAGLTGIEVDHQDHAPPSAPRCAAIARDLDLVVTGSSDFHGAGKVDHDLGCNTTDPGPARPAPRRPPRPPGPPERRDP